MNEKDDNTAKKKELFKNLFKSFPKKNQLLIILLCGILLVVIALPTSNGKNRNTGSNQQETKDSQAVTGYEDKVEARLEKALKNVEGVGNVKVMVTLRSSSEKVVEKDIEQSSQDVQEEDKSGGTRSTKDSTKGETTVYDSANEGEQSPYVSKEPSPEIEGVIVIADGGANPVVIENITEAVQALFDVDTHKIKIMKMIQRK